MCSGCELTALPTAFECAVVGKSEALYVSYDIPAPCASGDAASKNPHASVAIGVFLNMYVVIYSFLTSSAQLLRSAHVCFLVGNGIFFFFNQQGGGVPAKIAKKSPKNKAEKRENAFFSSEMKNIFSHEKMRRSIFSPSTVN